MKLLLINVLALDYFDNYGHNAVCWSNRRGENASIALEGYSSVLGMLERGGCWKSVIIQHLSFVLHGDLQLELEHVIPKVLFRLDPLSRELSTDKFVELWAWCWNGSRNVR